MSIAISNSINIDVSREQVINPFTTKIQFSDNISITVYNLQRKCDECCFLDKTGFLMISVKNKNFSNRLINLYFDFVDKYLKNGFITVVDKPYIHNIIAMDYDVVTKNTEINKLERIAQNSLQRITRLLGKRKLKNIKQITWNELENQTPGWLKREISSAYKQKGRLYNDLIERAKEILPQRVVNENNLENFSRFLVEEIPVLCTQYYLQNDRIVDFYPGKNPDFLWKIETGYYLEELPGISKYALQGSGLVYVDFQIQK